MARSCWEQNLEKKINIEKKDFTDTGLEALTVIDVVHSKFSICMLGSIQLTKNQMMTPRQFVYRTFRTKMKTDISYTRHFVKKLNENEVKLSSKWLLMCDFVFVRNVRFYFFSRNVRFYFCRKVLCTKRPVYELWCYVSWSIINFFFHNKVHHVLFQEHL